MVAIQLLWLDKNVVKLNKTSFTRKKIKTNSVYKMILRNLQMKARFFLLIMYLFYVHILIIHFTCNIMELRLHVFNPTLFSYGNPRFHNQYNNSFNIQR